MSRSVRPESARLPASAREPSPSSGSMSARDTAAARMRMNLHHQGSGPTIRDAVSVSNRKADVEFVAAATRGDCAEVLRLLPQATDVDVRTRFKGSTRSALHMAAANGSLDVVGALLDAGADPSSRMEWLRALTPLHVATTVPVAQRLLASGAHPVALDPREPDPAWYQRQQGRHDVADVISSARIQSRLVSNALAHAPSAAPAPVSSSNPPQRSKRAVIPSLTAADIALVRECWGCAAHDATHHQSGLPALALAPAEMEAEACAPEATPFRLPKAGLARRSIVAAPESDEHASSSECAVCMGELLPATCTGGTADPNPPLILLPCSKSSVTPHIFHSECLERWFLRKATCPTCRTDVRPLLKQHLSRQSQSREQQEQHQTQQNTSQPQQHNEHHQQPKQQQQQQQQQQAMVTPVAATTQGRPAIVPAVPLTPQRTTSFSSRGGRVRAQIHLKELVTPAPWPLEQAPMHADIHAVILCPGPSCASGSADFSSTSSSPRRLAGWFGDGGNLTPLLPQVQTLGRAPPYTQLSPRYGRS